MSTSWIKELNVELLKLHPGLVRNIEKRTENQLLVQSLVEACSGTSTQVYATGVRSRSEWQTLIQRGVTGGQGDFLRITAPDTNVKNIRKDTRFNLPFNLFSRRITRAASSGVCLPARRNVTANMQVNDL